MLRALNYIEAFGAQAVFGRPLRIGEMDSMIIAMNVKTAFQSRARYRDKDGGNNWTEWGAVNPTLNEILNAATLLAEKEVSDAG